MTSQRTFDEGNQMAATAIATTEPAAPTPMALIQTALAQNIDADKLEKLLDLQERWNKDRAIEAYSEAMNACQQELPLVFRDRTNSHTKAKYATLESLQEPIKPVYLKHGFSLSHGTADSPLANHYRCICDVTHRGGHTKQYFLDLPADDRGINGSTNKTPVQAIGSTLTYGQRYLEQRIFNVTIAGQDNDGNRPRQAVAISEEQEITLREWIENKGADLAAFLKAFDIEKLSDLPAAKFPNALDMLKRRKQGPKQ
jgi:hypothetical protein